MVIINIAKYVSPDYLVWYINILEDNITRFFPNTLFKNVFKWNIMVFPNILFKFSSVEPNCCLTLNCFTSGDYAGQWKVVLVIQHVVGLDNPSSSKWWGRNSEGGKRKISPLFYLRILLLHFVWEETCLYEYKMKSDNENLSSISAA